MMCLQVERHGNDNCIGHGSSVGLHVVTSLCAISCRAMCERGKCDVMDVHEGRYCEGMECRVAWGSSGLSTKVWLSNYVTTELNLNRRCASINVIFCISS